MDEKEREEQLKELDEQFKKMSKEDYDARDAWEEVIDSKTGKPYYYNHITKKCQDEKPPLYLAHDRPRDSPLLSFLRSDSLSSNPYRRYGFWTKAYWVLFCGAVIYLAVDYFMPPKEPEKKKKRKKRRKRKEEAKKEEEEEVLKKIEMEKEKNNGRRRKKKKKKALEGINHEKKPKK
eukprot:CAMPEP_0201490000 /NCGR_PEP_ID=MMETSP0151_2-20130828/24587_1 /ASSEMBLY_ACC=CAM_ASM_000257 /TAXON_ID=200890 /ORGANISM="Paramoeba atlantica, Strain 621/1 / CCAP 1560/9" /LENGTH=176 /DNA_ID=CAMNT_0047875779 /DNA_START=368 /DNA_END=899 /DNA_ORIENTATION=-